MAQGEVAAGCNRGLAGCWFLFFPGLMWTRGQAQAGGSGGQMWLPDSKHGPSVKSTPDKASLQCVAYTNTHTGGAPHTLGPSHIGLCDHLLVYYYSHINQSSTAVRV